MTAKSHTEVGLSAAAFLVLAAFLGWRIHYGVDFADEALASAAPFRFVLGDRPMHDEYMVYQFVALLQYPFIKIFYLLKGSTDGIILYNRYLFLCLVFLVSTSIFLAMKQSLGIFNRTLISLIYLAFIPYGLACLNYNSVGIGALTLAFFLSTMIEEPPSARSRFLFLLIGAIQGAGVFSYPTLAVSFLPASLYLLKNGRRGFECVAFYWLGAAAVPLTLFLCFRIDPKEFLAVIAYIGKAAPKSGHFWNLRKFILIFRELSRSLPFFWALVLWAIGFVLAVRSRFFFLRWIFAAALPILLFFTNRVVIGGAGIRGYFIELGVLGPLFLFLLRRTAWDWKLFFLVYLPSSCMAVMMAWSSGNGAPHAALGFIPAVIVTHLWLAVLIGGKKDLGLLTSLIVAVPALLTLGNLVYEGCIVFGEVRLGGLTARMESGVFEGLHTTPEKKEYWNHMAGEVLKRNVAGGVVFFYPHHFPAGYLLSSMRPATTVVWGGCDDGRDVCIDYFLGRVQKYGLLVRIKSLALSCPHGEPCAASPNFEDPALRRLETLAAKKEVFSDFDIYEITKRSSN